MGSTPVVEAGIGVLSRASEGNYFVDGHRGAGILAAELLARQLDGGARQPLLALAHEQLVGAAADLLSEPFPEEAATEEAMGFVLRALEESLDQLREVGHNVIVAALAIRGFHAAPELLTPTRAAGIAATLRLFHPWPTHDDSDGVLRGDLQADAAALGRGFAEESGAAFAAIVLREYLYLLDLWQGKGQGWAGHMLTFGHAVLELERLGYPQLFERSKESFRQYCAVCRRGPGPGDQDYPEPSDYPHAHLTPLEREYWERRTSVDIGHGIKYPYVRLPCLALCSEKTLRRPYYMSCAAGTCGPSRRDFRRGGARIAPEMPREFLATQPALIPMILEAKRAPSLSQERRSAADLTCT
eukprot:COSAG04_NODE_72_length_29124_cov_43.127265_16_plen_357_part_00